MRHGLRSQFIHLALATTVLFVLAGVLCPAAAQAKRIFVPRTHKLLKSAIDAAHPGDTIWVAAGTYYGPIVLKKQLVLFGDGGSDKTILDGKGSARVLHVEGVSRGAVIGFRISKPLTLWD